MSAREARLQEATLLSLGAKATLRSLNPRGPRRPCTTARRIPKRTYKPTAHTTGPQYAGRRNSVKRRGREWSRKKRERAKRRGRESATTRDKIKAGIREVPHRHRHRHRHSHRHRHMHTHRQTAKDIQARCGADNGSNAQTDQRRVLNNGRENTRTTKIQRKKQKKNTRTTQTQRHRQTARERSTKRGGKRERDREKRHWARQMTDAIVIDDTAMQHKHACGFSF
jgi:hypothetical protein